MLGHTRLESTVRYLGIDVDDAFGGANSRAKAVSTKLAKHVPSLALNVLN